MPQGDLRNEPRAPTDTHLQDNKILDSYGMADSSVIEKEWTLWHSSSLLAELTSYVD